MKGINLLFTLATIVLICGLSFTAYYFYSSHLADINTAEQNLTSEIIPDPENVGNLYMSMTDLVTNSVVSNQVHLHKDSFELERLFSRGMTVQYTPVSDSAAYYVQYDFESNENDADRIYHYNKAEQTNMPILSSLGRHERSLNWNDKNEVLVYSVVPSTLDRELYELLVTDREIYTYDSNTDNSTFIAFGSNPHWVPNTDLIVYIGEQGLRVFNYATSEDRELYKLISSDANNDVVIETRHMFDISPDGTKLIMTLPSDRVDFNSMYFILNLAVAADKQSLLASYNREIDTGNTQMYWPVFSPDGNYYAAQAIDLVGIEEREKARLQIYRVSDDELVREYNIDQFDFNQLFIDSWSSF